MSSFRYLLPILLLTLTGSLVQAAPPDERKVAERIDELLAARWKDSDVRPAERSDDAEFLRRVHLDLTGKIPSVAECAASSTTKRPTNAPCLSSVC